MLFLTEAEVRRLLPMKDCIARMRSVFEALGKGQATNQPRRRLILPTNSVLHQLAGAWGGYFGAKIYATNLKHGAHFLVLLYEAATAKPLAILEADHLGQIRTGAASGLATDLLAAKTATTMAVIGSGFQARSQVEAVCAVRDIRTIRVWSRTEEKRARFAKQMAEQLTMEVIATETAREAVEGAEVISTATWSKDPVLEADWIAAGAHINAIGTNMPNRREIPAELVRRARPVVVDSMEQARLEAGDLIQVFSEADWKGRAVELQEVLVGAVQRESRGDISLFKSVGLGVEDIAAAGLVYERAMAEQVGTDVPIFA